jgi:hypothetical protein
MLTPYSEAQKKRIANNIVKACSDITKLNKQAYNYLNLCSGFIAHYNHAGFISHYQDFPLINDIVANSRYNQWKNFTPNDRDYAYYMSKRDIYNMVLGALAAQEFIRDHFVFIPVMGHA